MARMDRAFYKRERTKLSLECQGISFASWRLRARKVFGNPSALFEHSVATMPIPEPLAGARGHGNGRPLPPGLRRSALSAVEMDLI